MFAGLFESLISVSMQLMRAVGSVINWLQQPLELGFRIPVIGFVGLNLGSPLTLIGSGILGLIVFWAVKSIVPFL